MFRGAQTQVAVAVNGIVVTSDVANVHGEVPEWLCEGRDVDLLISPQAVRLLARG